MKLKSFQWNRPEIGIVVKLAQNRREIVSDLFESITMHRTYRSRPQRPCNWKSTESGSTIPAPQSLLYLAIAIVDFGKISPTEIQSSGAWICRLDPLQALLFNKEIFRSSTIFPGFNYLSVPGFNFCLACALRNPEDAVLHSRSEWWALVANIAVGIDRQYIYGYDIERFILRGVQ